MKMQTLQHNSIPFFQEQCRDHRYLLMVLMQMPLMPQVSPLLVKLLHCPNCLAVLNSLFHNLKDMKHDHTHQV